MQISYHSALTKIQKKKKNFFLYQLLRLVLAGIARNWPIFKPEQNVDVSISVFVPVRYIPIDMVLTTLIISLFLFFCWTYSTVHFFFFWVPTFCLFLSFCFYWYLSFSFFFPFFFFPINFGSFWLVLLKYLKKKVSIHNFLIKKRVAFCFI